MKYIMPLVLMGLLSGCYKANISNFTDGGSPGKTTRVYAHTFIFGIVTLNEIDAKKICGDKGVWSVSSRVNLLSMVASGLLAGIYVPMAVQVTCKE